MRRRSERKEEKDQRATHPPDPGESNSPFPHAAPLVEGATGSEHGTAGFARGRSTLDVDRWRPETRIERRERTNRETGLCSRRRCGVCKRGSVLEKEKGRLRQENDLDLVGKEGGLKLREAAGSRVLKVRVPGVYIYL